MTREEDLEKEISQLKKGDIISLRDGMVAQFIKREGGKLVISPSKREFPKMVLIDLFDEKLNSPQEVWETMSEITKLFSGLIDFIKRTRNFP